MPSSVCLSGWTSGGPRSMMTIGSALVVAVLASPPANGELAARELLDAGDKLAARLDFEEASGKYEQALAVPELPRAVLLRAYERLAVTAAILLRRERALWAFARVLALDPAFALESDAPPKVKTLLDEARAQRAGTETLSLRVNLERAVAGQALNANLQVMDDSIGLARAVRLGWNDQHGATLPVATQGGVTFLIPAKEVEPPSLDLLAEVLDERGSVLAEWRGQVLVEARAPSPAVGPVPPRQQPALHFGAAGFFHLLAPGWGAELGVRYSFLPSAEIGVAATLGASLGAQALLSYSPSRARWRPYAEARASINRLSQQLVLGSGLCLGGTVELGPGRARAGVAGEIYAAPASYDAHALLLLVGYELDL